MNTLGGPAGQISDMDWDGLLGDVCSLFLLVKGIFCILLHCGVCGSDSTARAIGGPASI